MHDDLRVPDPDGTLNEVYLLGYGCPLATLELDEGRVPNGGNRPLPRARVAQSGGADVAQPIAALGEDAYWENSRRELVIPRGKYMIAIKLQPDSGDQPAAKVLAAKVLERLPR